MAIRASTARLYEPMEVQDQFHRCDLPERIFIGSNRAGKTVACAMDVGWSVQGLHPHLNYPKKNGRWLCVAQDEKELSNVMFPKLFEPGLFKIIRDEQTGEWRTYKPWNDFARLHETRPSFPLIPEALIQGRIAWKKKSARIPGYVRLKTGWEIIFSTNNADPLHGVDLDGAWFDEEIRKRAWYEETMSRLVDRSGRFIWSATPEGATEKLLELHDRAHSVDNMLRPGIAEFKFLIDNNLYIPEERKLVLKRQFESDPELYRVKILGEFKAISYLVYPHFSLETFGIDDFVVPPEWTRYLIVDPGYAVCAGLFIAVPPPDHALAGHKIVFDEFYLRQVNVRQIASVIREKTMGQGFQAFIIDKHGSARTESCGDSILVQYSKALEDLDVCCIEHGSGFIQIGPESKPGGTELKANISQVRQWMWPLEDGKPTLLVMRNRATMFVEEMRKYRRKKVGEVLQEEPDERAHSHMPACLRYAVLHRLPYIEPTHKNHEREWRMRRITQFLKQEQRESEKKFVCLG